MNYIYTNFNLLISNRKIILHDVFVQLQSIFNSTNIYHGQSYPIFGFWLKSQCWQARPWTFIFYIIFILTHQKSFNWFNLSSKYSNSMENITGKRSDPVRKIINIAQKTRQHCYTKLGKVTQKCHIQVPKKPC